MLCDVKFFIAYEFRSRMLGMLMGAMFDAAFRKFSAAFERRADAIYGRKTALGRRARGSFFRQIVQHHEGLQHR